MEENKEEIKKEPKLPPPIVDSVASVMGVIDKHVGRVGVDGINSRDKHELHLAKTYFVEHHDLFSFEQAHKLLNHFPGKNLSAISVPPMKLEELVDNCIKKKIPFLTPLDFSVLKKARVKEILPKYLHVLNAAKNEKNWGYYFTRNEAIAEEVFLRLKEKQSRELCLAAIAYKPALIFKSYGISLAEKKAWLDANPDKIKLIFTTSLHELVESYQNDYEPDIDNEALNYALDKYASLFLFEINEALIGEKNETIKNSIDSKKVKKTTALEVYKLHHNVFTTHPQIIDILDKKDPETFNNILREIKSIDTVGTIVNVGQDICTNLASINEHRKDDLSKDIILFIEKYQDILFNTNCIKRDKGVDFSISYVQKIFLSRDYELFEFVPIEPLSALDRQMVASASINELSEHMDSHWPIKTLAKLEVEDIKPVFEKIKQEDDADIHGRTMCSAVRDKVEALLLKLDLDRNLNGGALATAKHKI